MPPSFALPEDETDIFVSLWVAYPEAAPFRGVHFMRTYWRLNPGVTLEQAQADLTGIASNLASVNIPTPKATTQERSCRCINGSLATSARRCSYFSARSAWCFLSRAPISPDC